MKKNFLDIYTSLIISAVLVLVIFICYDFQFEIFSDRDLIRSQNLINSFEVYGADFGMQNGRRVPGGFNYYFLYLLINISSNILILNYIILSITLISFFFLLITNIKWLGTHGVIFSFIFFITSSTFILQIKQFWNPTLGLPFIILAFTFYLNFLNKQKKSFLFFAFTFVFLATQFHVSYSVFGFIFIILTIYYKLIDFLKLTFVFVISLIFTYFPLILNYFYPLINFDLNDYYLINSIKIEEIENNNVLFWIVRKIFLQLGSISNLIIEKK